MNPTEHLSHKERMARIGQLLAKGVTLMLTREAEEKRQAEEAQAAIKVNPADTAVTTDWLGDDHRTILGYLIRIRKASPREMQAVLEFPMATLFRRLKELQEGGLVVRSGKSSAVRYQPSLLAIRSTKQKKAGSPKTSGPNQP